MASRVTARCVALCSSRLMSYMSKYSADPPLQHWRPLLNKFAGYENVAVCDFHKKHNILGLSDCLYLPYNYLDLSKVSLFHARTMILTALN